MSEAAFICGDGDGGDGDDDGGDDDGGATSKVESWLR